jgi:hypothetical protein
MALTFARSRYHEQRVFVIHQANESTLLNISGEPLRAGVVLESREARQRGSMAAPSSSTGGFSLSPFVLDPKGGAYSSPVTPYSAIV